MKRVFVQQYLSIKMILKHATLHMFALFTTTGAHVFILLKYDLAGEKDMKMCDQPPLFVDIFRIPKFDPQI